MKMLAESDLLLIITRRKEKKTLEYGWDKYTEKIVFLWLQ